MAGLGRCDRVFGGGAGAGGEDHVGGYAGERGSAEFQPEYRWIECQTTGLRAGRERVYAKNHRFADEPADMDGIGRSYAGQQGWELANRMRNCWYGIERRWKHTALFASHAESEPVSKSECRCVDSWSRRCITTTFSDGLPGGPEQRRARTLHYRANRRYLVPRAESMLCAVFA